MLNSAIPVMRDLSQFVQVVKVRDYRDSFKKEMIYLDEKFERTSVDQGIAVLPTADFGKGQRGGHANQFDSARNRAFLTS